MPGKHDPFFCRPTRCLLASAILIAAVGDASAQQFADKTASLFPATNPMDYTNQLTVGDLDGDGDLDIVFANGGGFSSPGANQKARVYINTGGVFTDETDLRTGGHAGLYRGVELGDCDNDGDLDIVLAQGFNRLPNLLINNGSGFFTIEGATRLPALTMSSERAQFGDVDNDGDLDLFFVNNGNSPTNRFTCGQNRLYLNNGSCVYTDATSTNVPIESVCENMDCIFGDIDNDFDIDIRTAGRNTNTSRLYRNNGAGVFAVVSGVPADHTCYSYDFGDMDGDGDLDLLGINALPGSSSELLLRNDGTGAYTNASSQISPNTSFDDNDSKFFDIDNDGDLDLIIGRIGGPERVFTNNGSGNFALTAGVIDQVSDSTLDVKVADINNDGKVDVLTGQGESGTFQNRVYLNQGPADTLPPTIVRTEQRPDTLDTVGPYVVRALVLDHMTSDRNFFDDGIFLKYSVDSGPEQTVPMRFSGGQVYRGAIPGQTAGSEIGYYVSASDRAGNTQTGPVLVFDVLGPDCSALNDCSGHGTCVADNVCACDSGWSGIDCSIDASPIAGAVPDNANVPGTPLMLGKPTPGEIQLSWSSSCQPADFDYEVYEGTLGVFTSHVPLVCSTGGSTSLTLLAPAPDVYYLVVPRNGSREGSYGEATSGPRPVSASACLPQHVGPCP